MQIIPVNNCLGSLRNSIKRAILRVKYGKQVGVQAANSSTAYRKPVKTHGKYSQKDIVTVFNWNRNEVDKIVTIKTHIHRDKSIEKKVVVEFQNNNKVGWFHSLYQPNEGFLTNTYIQDSHARIDNEMHIYGNKIVLTRYKFIEKEHPYKSEYDLIIKNPNFKYNCNNGINEYAKKIYEKFNMHYPKITN